MQKWEYKTLVVALKQSWGFKGLSSQAEPNEITTALNELGEVGWELVSIEDISESAGVSKQVVLILKRPKA